MLKAVEGWWSNVVFNLTLATPSTVNHPAHTTSQASCRWPLRYSQLFFLIWLTDRDRCNSWVCATFNFQRLNYESLACWVCKWS
jgi:hypothetical protein